MTRNSLATAASLVKDLIFLDYFLALRMASMI